jgi:nicotinate phosphoribosyltransferase
LEEAVAFVRDFRYSEGDLRYLASVRAYAPEFLEFLGRLRFSGEIRAMPEGTVAFPHEPLLRVSAPFVEALLIESGLLQAINAGTLIATRAARITYAAQGRPVAEFSYRRAHAPFAVARSAYIGGCVSTSFVAAAARYGIPASGTIPHALVQVFEGERAAFAAVAAAHDRYTILLDTYDVRRAIHSVIDVAREAHASYGHTLAAVRLDSGDIDADSRYVRGVLDAASMEGVRIFASGDMDEVSIDRLVRAGAPIDAFGAGTSLGLPYPALGGVYKVVDYEGAPLIKLAGEKSTWPGVKQVFRVGEYEEDVIQLASEPPPARGAPLLQTVMQAGELVEGALPPLAEVRERAQHNLAALPAAWRALEPEGAYPVRFSPALTALRERVMEAHRHDGNGSAG